MSTVKKFKKIVFDISKKSKAFRVVFRNSRDTAYRVRMILDKPFGRPDDRLIYFITFLGRGYSDSPRAIYEYMMKTPEYQDCRFVWCFREPERFAFLKNERTELVRFRSKADNIALRTAKYWISNYRMMNHQYPRKDQVYVQCWHGTPLKRLGYDLEISDNAMNSGQEIRDKYKTDAEKFSYLLSPSPFATEKFASAWNLIETKQTHKIIEEGYPRNDRLIKSDPEERMQLRRQLGVEDKKVILYAPTWRDNQHTSGQGYTYRTEVDFDKLRAGLGDEYVILFRAHYLIANSFDFKKYEGFVRDVSSYNDINDLYIAADLLITDYSSVFFDYADLKKPMIFYMYDYDEYKNDIRDFYLDLSELPGPVTRTEDELIGEISRLNEYWPRFAACYERFNAKFNCLDDGQCSKRVIDTVMRSPASAGN